ncbi:uncharacterized protein N7459_000967 [Penicillium hispanicum]|uniref:uncharacterized protein n=1 Tax=Penicillium hispanicum TaxID=1080232 RepID=UPI002541F798|nr:uncharacterized protein N7459_000967 [Penicillium hispanicum]KAJ5594759.1 hypothetical protein N7459_000967 [Penicillium hispanicum]
MGRPSVSMQLPESPCTGCAQAKMPMNAMVTTPSIPSDESGSTAARPHFTKSTFNRFSPSLPSVQGQADKWESRISLHPDGMGLIENRRAKAVVIGPCHTETNTAGSLCIGGQPVLHIDYERYILPPPRQFTLVDSTSSFVLPGTPASVHSHRSISANELVER